MKKKKARPRQVTEKRRKRKPQPVDHTEPLKNQTEESNGNDREVGMPEKKALTDYTKDEKAMALEAIMGIGYGGRNESNIEKNRAALAEKGHDTPTIAQLVTAGWIHKLDIGGTVAHYQIGPEPNKPKEK